MRGDAPPCTNPIPIMTWQLANSQFTLASRQPCMILSNRPTFALVCASFSKECHKQFSPGSTVNVCLAHVYQHENYRFTPRSWLSHIVGKLLTCCTIQQDSQSFKWWSRCEERPICLTLVLLHCQPTAVVRFVFVALLMSTLRVPNTTSSGGLPTTSQTPSSRMTEVSFFSQQTLFHVLFFDSYYFFQLLTCREGVGWLVWKVSCWFQVWKGVIGHLSGSWQIVHPFPFPYC